MIASNRSKHPVIQSAWWLDVVPLAATLLIITASGSASAQDVIMSTPREPLVAPTLRETNVPPTLSRPPAPPETPYKVGGLVLHPHLSYRYTNAEGLPAPDGRRVASEIHRLAPGLSADLGEHWTFDYTPTWVSYTARTLSDSFDQSFRLHGATAFQDWSFQVSEEYDASSPTLVETGQQTEQETWDHALSGSYSFNPIVQFQASGGLNERYTEISPNIRSWSGGGSLNFVFSPRLNLNLGLNYNYSEITDAPDTSGGSYMVRLNWQASDKLTIGVSTGQQNTHSTSSAATDISSPLMNFHLDYRPFETTTLSVTASRTVANSFFSSQVTETARWGFSLNQRLLGRFYFSANYSPYESDYLATDEQTASGRQDSVETFSLRLSTLFFKRLSLAAFGTKVENQSNQADFNFSSKQYGIELKYSY